MRRKYFTEEERLASDREKKRAWALANPDKVNKSRRQWILENKEKRAAAVKRCNDRRPKKGKRILTDEAKKLLDDKIRKRKSAWQRRKMKKLKALSAKTPASIYKKKWIEKKLLENPHYYRDNYRRFRERTLKRDPDYFKRKSAREYGPRKSSWIQGGIVCRRRLSKDEKALSHKISNQKWKKNKKIRDPKYWSRRSAKLWVAAKADPEKFQQIKIWKKSAQERHTRRMQDDPVYRDRVLEQKRRYARSEKGKTKNREYYTAHRDTYIQRAQDFYKALGPRTQADKDLANKRAAKRRRELKEQQLVESMIQISKKTGARKRR